MFKNIMFYKLIYISKINRERIQSGQNSNSYRDRYERYKTQSCLLKTYFETGFKFEIPPSKGGLKLFFKYPFCTRCQECGENWYVFCFTISLCTKNLLTFDLNLA